MNDSVVIVYNGEQVSVPKEVADFLEQDRKRQQAQDKQDARHLSKSEFETVLSGSNCVKRPVELPLMLSVAEVAAVLGISRAGAYELAHSDGFPALKIAAGSLFRRTSSSHGSTQTAVPKTHR